MQIEFGNKKRNFSLMKIGEDCGTKFLVNVGHMSESQSLEDEMKKVMIAEKNGFDIIADNSITSKSSDYRKWIVLNTPMKLNTVPVYECFDSMQDGSFVPNMLFDTIERHIESYSDMIVVHPGLTRELAHLVTNSNRVIPLTSRGGAQLFSYIMHSKNENPYYQYWDEILEIVKDTGVALAIGLTLRAGSILDELDELYLMEMDICGKLIEKALVKNLPVVIEGIGHTRISSLKKLIQEVNKRCHNVPIKTLGPIGSDRLCGFDDINSLIVSSIAATSGVSIIGALLKSEHVGLPNVHDYDEGLRYYGMLKYMLELEHNSKYIEWEKKISLARRNRCWHEMFDAALYPENARNEFFKHNNDISDICSMCGSRCAHKLVLDDFR